MTRNSISHLSGQGTRYHAHADRQEHDYYATPPKALEVIIDRLQLSKNVWECACGGGHLSKVLEAHGHNVLSTDLYPRGYGVGGVDFLKQTERFDGDILTNPPYKYAQEFIEKALELTGGKVVMFLKVQFLEGIRRRDLFRKYPPKYVYVASDRFRCAPNGEFDPKATHSSICYCWFVWEKGYTGETILRWFN